MASGNDSFFDKDFNQTTEKEKDEVVHRLANVFFFKADAAAKKNWPKNSVCKNQIKKEIIEYWIKKVKRKTDVIFFR